MVSLTLIIFHIVNTFQRLCSFTSKTTCLFVWRPRLHPHRTFFIYALHEDIKDPLSSKFAGSVLSVYVPGDLTNDIDRLPSLAVMLAQVHCLREDGHYWPSNHRLLVSGSGGRKALQLRWRSLRYALKRQAAHWLRQH